MTDNTLNLIAIGIAFMALGINVFNLIMWWIKRKW